MRDSYHDDLDAVSATLVSMAAMVDNAIVRASKALLESDRALAEEVITADAAIDTVQHELDNRTVDLMARQAPVASDLRVLVTSLRMTWKEWATLRHILPRPRACVSLPVLFPLNYK